MPLRWISKPEASQSPLAPDEPVVILAAPGTVTPDSLAARRWLFRALAAGSLAVVAFRPYQAATPRALATTFSVNNLNPSGAGSLSQAVLDANANPGPDTITFSAGLTGTIGLTSTLAITDPVTIQGPGPGLLSVSGGNTRRVFYLGVPAGIFTATISGLTIRDGSFSGDGAGIHAHNVDLTLDNVAVISNTAGTNANGGGIAFEPSGAITVGLTISDSLISGNIAQKGGGIFLYKGSTDLVIHNTQIVSNTAYGNGGGVFLYHSNNVLIEDSAILTNTAGSKGSGGGIMEKYADTGTKTIRRTTISGNKAGRNGGGVYLYGTRNLLIEDSTIITNTAVLGGGGGIDIGHTSGISNTIRRTTISDNQAAGRGGGIFLYNIGSPLSIENSTVSGNHATKRGGGVYMYSNNPVNIRNSTIVSNTSGVAGGGIDDHNATLPITNTIVANNIAPAGPDITGTFKLSYDLVQVTGTATITVSTGNVFGLDPLLGPLADNGGPTRTHFPAHNSPAVDAGDPAFAFPPATDQRGDPRVSGGRVDIGAVETQELFLPLVHR